MKVYELTPQEKAKLDAAAKFAPDQIIMDTLRAVDMETKERIAATIDMLREQGWRMEHIQQAVVDIEARLAKMEEEAEEPPRVREIIEKPAPCECLGRMVAMAVSGMALGALFALISFL